MKLNYRPEIDGLRAIAVLAVILFHSHAQFLPSGYLGVDVFFVISGYLITQIIYQEMQNNTFSFIHFYQRRIKRIIPASLTVLIFTVLVSHFLFFAEDAYEVRQSAFWALLFSANLFFADASADYFTHTVQDKPLLHFWSLSVEEQFYFIFPLVLFLLFKYQKQNIQRVLFWLISLSLGYAIIYAESSSYYLLLTRAYQLLIGAFLVFIPNRILPRCLTYFSILFLVFILIFPKIDNHLVVIFKSLMVSFLTAVILFQDKSSFLSHSFLVKIGKISYSLYLWHWVFLAFAHYIFGHQEALSLKVLLICWVLTLIFSIFCYLKIENPIRRNKNFKFKPFFILFFVYVSLAFTLIWLNQKKLHQEINNYAVTTDKTICHDRIEEHLCKRGIENQKSTVLIIGDSHIAQYNRFFDKIGKHEGWTADVISVSQCGWLMQEREWYFSGNKRQIKKCLNMHDYAIKNISKYNYVITSAFWYEMLKNENIRFDLPLYTQETEQIVIDKLKKHFSELGKLNIPVYVLADNYSLKKYSYKKARFQVLNGYQIEYLYLDEQKRINQLVKDLVAPYPNIHWIDEHLNLIPKNFEFNGLPIYYDEDHFNPYGAEKLAEQFIKSGAKLIK